ncbi:MAG: hypothetical protein ACI9NC_004228 [Verrucomicrobiales bacterium]|jgi:hypothetical protein
MITTERINNSISEAQKNRGQTTSPYQAAGDIGFATDLHSESNNPYWQTEALNNFILSSKL